ncbi:MAG: GNAT family N-acetyltransferase [Actinomycetota bacterium]|nr:GNAT family N-acetyltransferase [Actinomycetota bacterium]
MEIHAFTADDSDTVAAVVDLLNAADKVDAPFTPPQTVQNYTAMMVHGWDGEAPETYAAWEDGSLVAVLGLWTSEWDNTHLAWADLMVHPDARRRGHGTQLLDFAKERARELGRRSVGSDGWDCMQTTAFAARHGLARKSSAIARRQVVSTVDPAVLEELYDGAVAAAPAYELLLIAGRTPDDMLDAVSEVAAAINDAPTDELDIEDEVFPPERVVAYETAQLEAGKRLYRVVARHRETGELSGHSVVAVEGERPEIGHQHDTSVVRAHRGHRLGLLLKTGMLRWLAEAEPRLTTIDTWNAESNDHMIRVNEQLGYQVLGRALQFQADVD